jgi:hypothetical protein
MPEGERRLDQRSADAVGTGGLVHHCVVERLCRPKFSWVVGDGL